MLRLPTPDARTLDSRRLVVLARRLLAPMLPLLLALAPEELGGLLLLLLAVAAAVEGRLLGPPPGTGPLDEGRGAPLIRVST